MDQTLHIRYEALNNIFGNVYYNVNNNEVLVFCPKHSHHKRKLSINIKKNAFRCFVCGYSSKSIFSLLYDYGNKTQRERYFNTLDVKFEESEKIETVDLPDNYTPVLDGKESIGGMIAYRYLRDEIGLPNSTILQSKIGFVPSGDYKGRVIFPSYNKEGQLNYFITRRVDGGNYKKYLDCSAEKKNIIFNELFVDFNKPVIIVENIKTHFKHFEVSNIVPIMGTKLNEDYKLFQDIVLRDCPKVYIAFDKDAYKNAVQLVSKFQHHGVDARIVQTEKQADELTTMQFVNRIASASKFSRDDILVEKIKSLCA